MCKEEIINSIEKEITFLENCLKKMTKDIGPIPIANTKIMPMGWRKAAKGRTVWRIIEEIMSQNLETKYEEYGFELVSPSDSEVSVYDFQFKHPLGNISYVNIKSSVLNGKKNKDDISKAKGLELFYRENPEANLYISTFVLDFKPNMTIDIVDVVVFPVPWLPDIYINPSNNGNLQSSKYKNLDNAIKRTNSEFLKEFDDAHIIAIKKRLKKLNS